MSFRPIVALALALASCQTAAPSETGLAALGTEPFWSVEILPAALRYSTPDNIAGTVIPVTRRTEAGGTMWSGTFAGAPFVLRLAPGPCNDGMSDSTYRFTARLMLGSQVLRGCAGKRPGAPG